MSLSSAVVFKRPGEVEICSLKTPQPTGKEVLVRVLGCTLCGSDLHTFDGRRSVSVPSILGHEIVGQILDFGKDAKRVDLRGMPLAVGDRVTWAIVANCEECFYCRRGLPQKCLHAFKYGHEPLDRGCELSGGLAEHCLLVQGTKIVGVPKKIPLAVACPASCATATAMAALAPAGDLNGRSVLIMGAGMLGLTACAIAASRGAAQVVCVDPVPHRREQSRSFGANLALDTSEIGQAVQTLLNGHGFDIAIEMSGALAAFSTALFHLRMGGLIVLIGTVLPTPSASVDLEQIVRRCVRIQGIHNYSPQDLANAVAFLENHYQSFPFESLVSHWFPLAQIDQALAQARQPGAIRVGMIASA